MQNQGVSFAAGERVAIWKHASCITPPFGITYLEHYNDANVCDIVVHASWPQVQVKQSAATLSAFVDASHSLMALLAHLVPVIVNTDGRHEDTDQSIQEQVWCMYASRYVYVCAGLNIREHAFQITQDHAQATMHEQVVLI